ncbi:nickel/cobalt transporter [Halomonas sp. TBZ9]|uniref:Nickel/cobalt efflux system n=1 Tax=Vreelandella azerica TaxID=2732867 RepID=A0A7Y3XAH9_9GAMM|nr:nickel/cobalt transporter [Halomonas azerica]NOG31306.1 nickel/cobalt transporter [Halomonas azerica]
MPVISRYFPLFAVLIVCIGLLGYMLSTDTFQTLSYQLLAWQRDLHRSLTLAITELAQAPTAATWGVLLGVSFGYGVFHAAGPGHGKAVLSTYLASHGGGLHRALGLSFAAALMQGVTAILLVVVLVYILGWVTRQAMGSVATVEHISFLLVATLGGWLCWRAVSQLRAAYAPRSESSSAGHDHSHEPGAHHHCCHGAHHIEPEQALDKRTALMTVLAIGIRPCSGAVLMVGAASLLGNVLLGMAAVLAMSLGTGLTVSMLALATIFARDWAKRRLAGQQRQLGQRLAAWLALAGGSVIVVLGLSLFASSATQPVGSPLLNEPTRSANPLTG